MHLIVKVQYKIHDKHKHIHTNKINKLARHPKHTNAVENCANFEKWCGTMRIFKHTRLFLNVIVKILYNIIYEKNSQLK